MDLTTEYVELAVDDGTSMRGYVARPTKAAASRGLIVCQEAFGVNAHIREVTERLARQGFLAIAPELFHRTGPGFEGRYDDISSVMVHIGALSDDGMAADLRAAHAWLTANGQGPDFQVAAVGFCMGGRAAILTGLTLPVACAVSFYGGGIAPNANNPGLLNRIGELHAPALLFWGGRDKHIGPDQIRAVTEALRNAGKNYINVEISDADHGFFCDARASYNPVAASQAWALVVAFLDAYTSHREDSQPIARGPLLTQRS
jgi:carboxymethylenebutenolidase